MLEFHYGLGKPHIGAIILIKTRGVVNSWAGYFRLE